MNSTCSHLFVDPSFESLDGSIELRMTAEVGKCQWTMEGGGGALEQDANDGKWELRRRRGDQYRRKREERKRTPRVAEKAIRNHIIFYLPRITFT